MEDTINDAVIRLSKISFLAALNLHHFVYDAIVLRDETALVEALLNGREPIIRSFYNEVSYSKRNRIRSDFSTIMENIDIPFIDAGSLNNIMHYDRGTYITCFMNQINRFAETYVKRLFKLFHHRNDIDRQYTPTREELRERAYAIDRTLR